MDCKLMGYSRKKKKKKKKKKDGGRLRPYVFEIRLEFLGFLLYSLEIPDKAKLHH